jgi:carbon monoxide dehydrogenase subunit G
VRVEGSFTVAASSDRVWQVLLDPASLQRCIPGCERIEAAAEGAYRITLTVGVASVKGSYSGEVAVLDPKPPESLVLKVQGQGRPGFVRGQATITLMPTDGGTTVSCQGEGTVGGAIAGVGQRMLGAAAKLLMGQFFERLAEVAAETRAGGEGPAGK